MILLKEPQQLGDRLKAEPPRRCRFSSLSSGVDDSIEEARDRVRELQDDAFAMDAVLKNADRCEFVMVAAPTDLSLTETDDLKRSLDESGVKAQRLVVNGVLDEEACKNFASSSLQTQRENLEALDALARELYLSIATAPQFDEDLDGLEGWRRWGGRYLSSICSYTLFQKSRVDGRLQLEQRSGPPPRSAA